MDSDQIGKRPFRVNTQGDVEMAPSRTFDANGSTFTNLAAPAAPTSAAREQDVTLARALANDPDAGGATIVNLGAPSGPTSPVRVQDDAHHLVVSSTDTAVIDATLLGDRIPANTHILVRFTGGGVKTLEIASDLAASSVNGMLITVSARSSSSFSVNVDVKDGDFEGRSGPVEVSASTTGAV